MIYFRSSFWQIAGAFGARCYETYDDKITHVICAQENTDKYKWGIKNKKFVVHVSWLVQCIRRWYKPPEEHFSIATLKNCSKVRIFITPQVKI